MAVAPEVEQYLEAFLVEASEELQQLETCLARLRKEGARLAIVEDAARATANLKSAAATMGFRSIRDLSHATWDMLNAWRRGGVKDPAVSLELLTLAFNRLDEFIKMLREGRGPEPSVADLTLQLRALVTEEAENPWPEAEPSTDRQIGEHRVIVKLSIDSPSTHPVGRFLVCQGYLLGLGRVIASDPPPQDHDHSGLTLRFLLATTRDVAEVRRTMEMIPHVSKVEVTPATPELDSLPAMAKEKKRSIFQDWTVHIEARHLEEMGEIAAELAQIRAAYRSLEHEVEKLNPSLAFRLSRLGDRSEYPLRQLSELVAQFRQIPLEFLFDKLTRFAMEQAKAAGKECEVKAIGGHITVGVDQAEMLLHPLQRVLTVLIESSAMDSEARMAAGKKRANRIELAANQNETKITLSLSDDGSGLDLDEAFKPGGVLAGIRTDLEPAGGSLDGQSWPGQGTLLHVEIAPPGTHFDILAIELGKDLYALPLGSVIEARRSAEENVVKIDGRTYLPQNREMTLVLDLAALLGRDGGQEAGFWLFLRAQEQQFILRVPNVLGSRRVMSRPSPSGFKVPGLAGACSDSSGRIYIVLSPEQLIKLAGYAVRPMAKQGREANA